MSKVQVVKISTHRKVLKAHVFNIFHSLLTTSSAKQICKKNDRNSTHIKVLKSHIFICSKV